MASIKRLESLESFKIMCWLRNCNEVGTRLNLLPSTLTKISCQSYTPFDCNIFKVLARQSQLRVLKIQVFTWEEQQQPQEVSVVAGEFPQLQVLKLRNLKIKTWEMEKDAMPNLESLFIHSCDYLEYLPEDELLCRRNLQLVELCGWKVPDKLKTMLTDFKNKNPDTPCKINFKINAIWG